MTPRQRPVRPQIEGQLSLAIACFNNNPSQKKRTLASAYNVPESTLRSRLKGTTLRFETAPVNWKLSSTEEQSLIQWIPNLDQRGFPPQVIDVRRMADALLAGCGQTPPPPPVGQNWVSRFISR
jgi:hypothetical protein